MQTYFYGTCDHAIVFSSERNGFPRAIFVKITYAEQHYVLVSYSGFYTYYPVTVKTTDRNPFTRPSKAQLSHSTDEFHETQPHSTTSLKKKSSTPNFVKIRLNVSRTFYFVKTPTPYVRKLFKIRLFEVVIFKEGWRNLTSGSAKLLLSLFYKLKGQDYLLNIFRFLQNLFLCNHGITQCRLCLV